MSEFDGINRSVAPTSLQWAGSCRPLDEDLIHEYMAEILEVEIRKAPTLMPAELYEIVLKHDWGKEAAAWCQARYDEQFGGAK